MEIFQACTDRLSYFFMAFATFLCGNQFTGPVREPGKGSRRRNHGKFHPFPVGRMWKCQPAGAQGQRLASIPKSVFFLALSTVPAVDFVDNPPPYRPSPYKGVACPANCTLIWWCLPVSSSISIKDNI